MSDRMIFALLAVAVFCPANKGQSAPGYYLKYGQQVMLIDKWWGRAEDFPAVRGSGAAYAACEARLR
jgi:hypothetical protein